MSDHVKEARQHIDWAHEQQSEDGQYDFSVRDNALIAQAEATLALAEQQRIANLIAWGTANGTEPDWDLTAEIKEALGL